jgi:hypothetical protein
MLLVFILSAICIQCIIARLNFFSITIQFSLWGIAVHRALYKKGYRVLRHAIEQGLHAQSWPAKVKQFAKERCLVKENDTEQNLKKRKAPTDDFLFCITYSLQYLLTTALPKYTVNIIRLLLMPCPLAPGDYIHWNMERFVASFRVNLPQIT